MAAAEINLLTIDRGAITAPAGCGKTELIARALTAYTGDKPILVLTHTNAGVAALRARLSRAKVPGNSYRLATLDGWALRLIKTFPALSGHHPSITQCLNPSRDYTAIRTSAYHILRKGHLNHVLKASYGQVIIDEYQDCNILQHELVCALAQVLRICVLGDPMQAIFGFKGNVLVNWENHVHSQFPPAGMLEVPWRWKNVDAEPLGQWLLWARQELASRRPIDLTQAPAQVVWHQLGRGNDDEVRQTAAKTPSPGPGCRVLVIGESARTGTHHTLAMRTPGAVVIEAVTLNALIAFSNTFSLTDTRALQQLLDFAKSTMTGVAPTELMKRLAIHARGTAKTPPTPFEHSAMQFQQAPSYRTAYNLLQECHQSQGTRVYRPAILYSGLDALRMADQKGIPLLDAALAIREEYRARGRVLPARAVGSTLLLKGLEAEVAVVLNAEDLSPNNLYVAMTRGSMQLVICSSTPFLGS